MEARRKVKAKAKEKSERKKALSSMSTDKKKTSEKTSERKQKVRRFCVCLGVLLRCEMCVGRAAAEGFSPDVAVRHPKSRERGVRGPGFGWRAAALCRRAPAAEMRSMTKMSSRDACNDQNDVRRGRRRRRKVQRRRRRRGR